ISGKTARAARKIPRKAARVGLLLGSGFRLFAETLLPECSRTQYKDQCETDYERACFSDLGGAEVGWRVLNAGTFNICFVFTSALPHFRPSVLTYPPPHFQCPAVSEII